MPDNPLLCAITRCRVLVEPWDHEWDGEEALFQVGDVRLLLKHIASQECAAEVMPADPRPAAPVQAVEAWAAVSPPGLLWSITAHPVEEQVWNGVARHTGLHRIAAEKLGWRVIRVRVVPVEGGDA